MTDNEEYVPVGNAYREFEMKHDLKHKSTTALKLLAFRKQGEVDSLDETITGLLRQGARMAEKIAELEGRLGNE